MEPYKRLQNLILQPLTQSSTPITYNITMYITTTLPILTTMLLLEWAITGILLEQIVIQKSLRIIPADFNVKVMAASDPAEITDDSVGLAMKYIFSHLEIYDLEIADGLKQLLYEKKYDMDSLLQSNAASLSRDLGIEEYVAKIIIDAAKRKATE